MSAYAVCKKPGCGAQQIVGRPCTDWDCPQHNVPPEAYRALEQEAAKLRESLEEARGLVIEANNSLFGSHGYFHSLNGGGYDRYHLAREIEALKEYGRKQWQRAEPAALASPTIPLQDRETTHG